MYFFKDVLICVGTYALVLYCSETMYDRLRKVLAILHVKFKQLHVQKMYHSDL